MNELVFEWDINKEKANLNKHGIDFSEAMTVFDDIEAVVFDDPDHSTYEERFIILGVSNRANLLLICHCYRRDDSVIRIISARKATRKERNYYYNN